MKKTAGDNVTVIVTRPPEVTGLQESVPEDVNQNEQESIVIRVKTIYQQSILSFLKLLLYVLRDVYKVI